MKWTLIERQREILSDVQGKIRDVRSERFEKDHAVLDPGETSEVAIQEDIEFALIQMKAETLNRIDEALSRFEDGTCGHCFGCGEDIALPRLRGRARIRLCLGPVARKWRGGARAPRRTPS